MRTTNMLMATLKESPSDAELISHQLMLRAGLIRKLASGLYTWMPLGLKILHKVSRIVRNHMDAVSAQEMLMPAIQPAVLWEETGRWDVYGPMLLKMKDRHEREFCFGPTHEEVITDLMRKELKSYKQLPSCLYQIQTKFRDEIRPRFGVMRAREFLMKDAYSFHADEACLQKTYDDMYKTYCQIFEALGLKYRPVMADSGEIGGNQSHEFHVLAESGEDEIAYCEESDFAANTELGLKEGDDSPDGKGKLKVCRGIEVGHIFALGDKYSKSMNLNVLSESGKSIAPLMGCYGIGVSRIVAAAIEQNHDDRGIIWPDVMAPFTVAIVPMNMHKSYRVKAAAEKLYQELMDANIEVIFDTRKERPGVMFADMELIGIPHRIVIGEKGLDNGVVEYQHRSSKEKLEAPIESVLEFLKSKIN